MTSANMLFNMGSNSANVTTDRSAGRRIALSLLRFASLAVCTLMGAGCAQNSPAREGVRQIIEVATDNTAKRNALRMENPTNADERWKGMQFLVDHSYGKNPPYTTRYAQIARNDTDPVVRAYAVRALNRSRDGSAIVTYIGALEDENDMVRLEAAKALSNVPDERAIPALLKHLPASTQSIVDGRASFRDETMDVRIAVAKALRHYKNAEVARALVDALDDRDFSIAYQSRESLMQITGKDHSYDAAAWLTYLAGPEKPLG